MGIMRLPYVVVVVLVNCAVGLTLAQPYFYDDYSYYDMYDNYDLYNMHYNYDMMDEDYLDWDTSPKGGKEKEEEDYYGYHPYFSYYDDIYGDYFFDDPFETEVDCMLEESGKVKLEGIPACDLKIEGADAVANMLEGGIDGVYKVFSCENGRPLYKREGSPPNEERVLWYSATFRDWDLNNGTVHNEDDILMYGGQGDSELRPQFVPGQWHVASDLQKGYTGVEDYVPVDLTVKCADGSESEVPTASTSFGKRPLLTDEEMEKQYSIVYKRAAKKAEQSADINLGLVSMFVFVGLAIVFGLPFMVARTRKSRRRQSSQRGEQPAGFKLSNIVASNKKSEHSQ